MSESGVAPPGGNSQYRPVNHGVSTPTPPTCLHQFVEEQASRTPNNIAVTAGGKSLSYRELNARANRFARDLRDAGVHVTFASLSRTIDRSKQLSGYWLS